MTKKYLLIVCSILVLALALCACSSQSGGQTPAPQEQPSSEAAAEKQTNSAGLEDGVYLVDVDTGSNMFHINEAKHNTGELTVAGGQMTLHVTLPSKNIVNLFLGTAEEAQKAEEAGEALIEPTIDEVTYDDGETGEVYGFDIPMAGIGTPVDVAIIGTHGNWYTHPVTITNPRPAN